MKRSLLSLVAIAALALPAGAQTDATNPGGAYFRLGGGVTVPLGDFADAYNLGFRGLGTIGWQLAGMPLGFDLDVAYDRVRGDEVGIFDFEDVSILSGTANVRWDFPTQGTIGFYVSGGGGIYRFSDYGVDVDLGKLASQGLRLGGSAEDVDETTTEFGVRVGAGVTFGRGNTRGFVEASYNSVFTEGSNTNFVPIVVGVQFGPPRM
jgi:opacity protein-like surface antigen